MLLVILLVVVSVVILGSAIGLIVAASWLDPKARGSGSFDDERHPPI